MKLTDPFSDIDAELTLDAPAFRKRGRRNRKPVTQEEASLRAKAHTNIETFDPRLLKTLLRAGAGETITFYVRADHTIPPIDPADPRSCLLSAAERRRWQLLNTLKRRLSMLRRRLFESNHPLSKTAYRTQIALYPIWSRNGPGPKRGTLEVRPQDSNIDALLSEVIGETAELSLTFDEIESGIDIGEPNPFKNVEPEPKI